MRPVRGGFNAGIEARGGNKMVLQNYVAANLVGTSQLVGIEVVGASTVAGNDISKPLEP